MHLALCTSVLFVIPLWMIPTSAAFWMFGQQLISAYWCNHLPLLFLPSHDGVWAHYFPPCPTRIQPRWAVWAGLPYVPLLYARTIKGHSTGQVKPLLPLVTPVVQILMHWLSCWNLSSTRNCRCAQTSVLLLKTAGHHIWMMFQVPCHTSWSDISGCCLTSIFLTMTTIPACKLS